MQKAAVIPVTNNYCSKMNNNITLEESQVCADSLPNCAQSNTCRGDSGGPMVRLSTGEVPEEIGRFKGINIKKYKKVHFKFFYNLKNGISVVPFGGGGGIRGSFLWVSPPL